MHRFKRWLRKFFLRRARVSPDLRQPILMIERRHYPRVPSRNLIRVLSRDQLQLDHLFNLADFSEGGLRIRTDLDAHPGSTLQAIVNFRERNLHVDLKLRVVWVRKSRRGYAWGGQMGVETLHNNPDHRMVIKYLVMEKMGRLRAA